MGGVNSAKGGDWIVSRAGGLYPSGKKALGSAPSAWLFWWAMRDSNPRPLVPEAVSKVSFNCLI